MGGGTKPLHVVAGIVSDGLGRVLLSSRPPGKPYAGYWEFAGGKVEAGESEFDALKREFWEELGMRIDAAVPWLAKVYVYEHATVHLRFFRVAAGCWSGGVRGREGQRWAWQKPGDFSVSPMLPANGPLLEILSWPTDLSGSLNSGFHSPDGAFRIVPWALAEPPYRHVLLTAETLARLGRLPQAEAVWLLVSDLAEFERARDADAVVWRAEGEAAAQTVLQVLRDGAAVPVAVSAPAALVRRFGGEWRAAGAQAVMAEDVTDLA
ncbi:MAG: NUDIX domain-containing protein [Neisseria sp.]|nr:NUDIX domain-containing protein [Neisseria sp.]